MIMKKFITKDAEETRALGVKLALTFKGGEIICLRGELGAGKTTFAQGVLRALGVRGPYTSPTFVVIKQYKIDNNKSRIRNVYHLDTYRVEMEDVLALSWDELVADKDNVIIIEWPDKMKKIIPDEALWIDFKWLDENKREIVFSRDIDLEHF